MIFSNEGREPQLTSTVSKRGMSSGGYAPGDGHPDGKARGDAVGAGVEVGVATGDAVRRGLGLGPCDRAVGATLGVALGSIAGAVRLGPRLAVDPMVEHPLSTMTAASDANGTLMAASCAFGARVKWL